MEVVHITSAGTFDGIHSRSSSIHKLFRWHVTAPGTGAGSDPALVVARLRRRTAPGTVLGVSV